MNGDFLEALEQIQKSKGIPMVSLIHTVEGALQAAYKKQNHGATEQIRLDINHDQGTVRVIARQPILPPGVILMGEGEEAVVVDAEGTVLDISPSDIQYEDVEINASDFGRIAAQTAKQVVMQRIREAEREIVFDEFSHRVGEVVTGEVQRRDNRNVIIQLGRIEALLPANEQIPGESYRFNDRAKVYLLDVRKTTKNPQIIVSRTHPNLVLRLFELEVPEVFDGIVQIKSVAREPGARSKVAVYSRDPQIDPVGACVGHRGTRVQAIVDELRGEKIDIVRFNDDIDEYLRSALSPAKVSQVLVNMADRAAIVIAPDNQLSLAIGRRGQNVRLAAQLTGWRIDIRSESQWAEKPEPIDQMQQFTYEVVDEIIPGAENVPDIASERIRIYELARELGVESKDLVEILQEEGIQVTSHASSIPAEQANMIREMLMGGEGTLEDFDGEFDTDEDGDPVTEEGTKLVTGEDA